MRQLAGCWLVMLGCASSGELDALQTEIVRITDEQQPALAALEARIAAIKRDLRGNPANWQTMLRTAQLANDELGLPPFEQVQPPGPTWRPSPATLLGIAPYVHEQAATLAARHDLAALRHLVDDERQRYAVGIAEASDHLAQVELWLAAPHRR